MSRFRCVYGLLLAFALPGLLAVVPAPTKIAPEVPDPSRVEEVKMRFAEASSVLRPQLGRRPKDYFSPRKAIDSNWDTCWSEGAEGPGDGEWIKVLWLTREAPSYVGILPGWAKTHARWKNNPRLKTVEIVLSNGFEGVAHLKDEKKLQFFRLKNRQPAEWLQIKIREVYPGERFEDASVGEIKVFRKKPSQKEK